MSGRQIALLAARAADAKRAGDIVIYDLRGISDVADYFVIATAASKLQARAISGELEKELKRRGVKKLGREGAAGSQWILLDYTDTVIHILSPELRAYYSLESLWGDAPKVEWGEKEDSGRASRKRGVG